MSMSRSTNTAEHRYLRLHDMQRLRHLRFAPRRTVEGLFAGRHASRQRGQSVEFADYRDYTPGDEPNHVDWKVFGRSDRMFVKLFEHQTNMSVHLLIDASSSMAFTGIDDKGQPIADNADPSKSGGAMQRLRRSVGIRKRETALVDRKYDQAALLASAIAFLTFSQQDRVSLSIAQDGLANHIPSQSRMPQLRRMLQTMQSYRDPKRSAAKLSEAVESLHRMSSRRSVLVVLSDLMEEHEPIIQALSRWTARGSEVIVFQTLHEQELHLPDLEEAILTDSETGQKVRLRVDDLREAYQKRLRDRLDLWHTTLRGRGIDHNLVSTQTPYHEALKRYLFRRTAATR